MHLITWFYNSSMFCHSTILSIQSSDPVQWLDTTAWFGKQRNFIHCIYLVVLLTKRGRWFKLCFDPMQKIIWEWAIFQIKLICIFRCSVSKQVSALGPLPSRTEKQMARLLVSIHKLSTPFRPSSEPSWGQWSECGDLFWHGATRLPSACCFPHTVGVHA